MERGLIRPSLFIVIVLSALMVAGSAAASVDAEARLLEAGQAFETQDYEAAIKLLRPLVAEEAITDPGDLRRSLERLAASYWFTGATDAARLTFGTLLKDAPDHPLDPLYYPQELISFFEAEKQRLKDLGFIGSVSPKSDRETSPRMTLVKKVIERPMPTIGYLMPFGVGQFANQESGKGTLLAVLQGIGLATNIAAWITVEVMKAPGTKRVSTEDAGRAEVMEILWWIGTSLFTGAYAYSVIDGLVLRPPGFEEQRRFELIGPDDARAPKGTGKVSLRLGPGPGVGLGLFGNF